MNDSTIGAIGGVIGAVVVLHLMQKRFTRSGKMGINLEATSCPGCGLQAPTLRRPRNLRQLLWGGYTCQDCGVEFDKYGTRVAGSGSDSELHESSTSFDAENVRPFLLRVSGLIDSGFGELEIDQVMHAIRKLPVDEETELSFQIVNAGSVTQLHLTVFADDIDVADIAFFTPKPLAEAIDSEMDAFLDELGI